MEKKIKTRVSSALIVANWKCYPQSVAEVTRLAKASDRKGVVICPPFPYLSIVKKLIKKAALGAQDVFWDKGAYTGEVSVEELKDIGVSYVIVGHSERRSEFRESDTVVAKKAIAVIRSGLKAVVCVGEDAKTRNSGIAIARKKIVNSLMSSLADADIIASKDNLIVAYEPLWAIGTDNPDKPEDAASVASAISEEFSLRFGIHGAHILYGGSVNAENAKNYISVSPIAGLLIGRASTDPKKFPLLLDSLGIRK